TPQEATTYTEFGANVITLPLRGLSQCIGKHDIRARTPLHVFFMGASYSVEHNRAAARQFIEVAEEAQRRAPGTFVFHIFRRKLPQELQLHSSSHLVYEGYVENLETRLAQMDIALTPSLMGAGMQQKVFEPIVRGIPTITSPRAIAGYDLVEGREYSG